LIEGEFLQGEVNRPVRALLPRVRVREVLPDGLGARAGLRKHDIIVAVGDRPTPHVDALHRLLGSKNVGASLELKLLRNGRVHVQAIELPW